MKFSDDFRRCLIDLDVIGIRRLWQHVSPHLPQPETDAEALASIHIARTQARSVPFRLRAYSHAWLTERNLPSHLPDRMKPRAERMYPKVVGVVGISVRNVAGRRSEYGLAMESAMSEAVLEAYADGKEEPTFVKARMMEAKEKFRRQN